MKYDNKLAIAVGCDECQWHWQCFQHLTFLDEFFAGGLTAPTMKSTELRDGTQHAALGSCFGRQTAKTNQIMLILFRGERKAKCSLTEGKLGYGEMCSWLFCQESKSANHLNKWLFHQFYFSHNKDKVSQSICRRPMSGIC